MAASSNSMFPEGAQVYPVILHNSFLNTELHTSFLKENQVKIRVSSTIPDGSCVFPMSSLTFTILDARKYTAGQDYETQLFKRLDKSLLMCYTQYVLLVSPLIGKEQEQLLSSLYKRYLNETNIKILPSHNLSECVQVMMSISKVTVHSVSSTICSRHSQTMSKLILREGTITDALQVIGIDQHESNVLFDGCGCLEAISGCGISDLLECTSLDTETASKVVEFIT